jgi:hypothetical protein
LVVRALVWIGRGNGRRCFVDHARHPSNERKWRSKFSLAAPPGRKQADEDGGPHLFLHIPRPDDGITVISGCLFKIDHVGSEMAWPDLPFQNLGPWPQPNPRSVSSVASDCWSGETISGIRASHAVEVEGHDPVPSMEKTRFILLPAWSDCHGTVPLKVLVSLALKFSVTLSSALLSLVVSVACSLPDCCFPEAHLTICPRISSGTCPYSRRRNTV